MKKDQPKKTTKKPMFARYLDSSELERVDGGEVYIYARTFQDRG